MAHLSKSDTARGHLLGLSEELGPNPGQTTYISAVTALLARLLPSEMSGWNSVDVGSQQVRLEGPHTRAMVAALPDLPDRMLAVADDHPMIRSYLFTAGDTLTPRRMSDLVSDAEFRRGQTYAELFRPLSVRFQLTILTAKPGATYGNCWTINRSSLDFSDDEVGIATVLQPSLALLDSAYPADSAGDAKTACAEARARAGITAREAEVLELVAKGLTAHHIAHRLRISHRTVRKHLEHVYTKLDTHDRLMAVAVARARRLLP